MLTVRSYKGLNEKDLQTDLDMAPWHVSGIFDSIDDQYSYWNTLLSSIINDHAALKKDESPCSGRTVHDARMEKGN